MADVTKDVSIRFLGDDQASAVADKVSASVTRVGQQSKLAADQAVQSAIAETKWADSSVKASVEQDKLAESTKRQGDAAKKTSTDVNDLTNVFKLLAASIVVKEFIDANVAVEKFTLGMTQIVGSADAAGKEFEYVRGVANRLGIDIADAASGFLTFSAATKGSALEGAGARTIFEAVAGTMASLGRSSIDTQGALVQLAQGVSKGKFELEDLKSIAERMPGFFLNFATAIGKTVPELFDLISAGKITGAEFLIFAEQMNKGIAGIEFNTFNSELARLKNALFDASVTIGQSGVFDALTKGIQIATAAVVGAVAAFQLLGTVYGTIIGAITTGNFSNLGDAIDQAFQKAGNATTAARDAMLGYGDAVDKVKPKVESTGQVIQDEMTGTVQVSEAATRGAEKLGAQLGALGIDPKKLKDPIDQHVVAPTLHLHGRQR